MDIWSAAVIQSGRQPLIVGFWCHEPVEGGGCGAPVVNVLFLYYCQGLAPTYQLQELFDAGW